MTAETPFHDLNDYLAIPRVTGLRLSPDGSWLAASVQSLSPDKKKYVTSIWRIDTAGGPPARLTRSADGEGNPRFLPDGALLFTTKRPDPDSAGNGRQDTADEAALWLLPAGGGEARQAAALPGGIAGAETAAGASGGHRDRVRPCPGRLPRTRRGGRPGRTPGSPRSCTTRCPCGTGTTISGPTTCGFSRPK